MDDGFDLSLPVFAGKIVGRYTIDCSAAAADDRQARDGGDAEVVAPDARDTKEAFIAALAEGDHTCHLRPGVSFDRPVALEGIAKYRSRWNLALQQGRPILDELTLSEAMEIQMTFAAAAGDDGTAFHGTATAATIAYVNPDVRLVVVQVSLSSQMVGETGEDVIVSLPDGWLMPMSGTSASRGRPGCGSSFTASRSAGKLNGYVLE